MSNQVEAYRIMARENLKRACIKRHLRVHEQRKLVENIQPGPVLAVPRKAVIKAMEDLGMDVPDEMRPLKPKSTH